MMEVFLSILSVVVMSSPISIPFVLIIGYMLIDVFKYLKAAKWAEPPKWKIEYFGKINKARFPTREEMLQRYPDLKYIDSSVLEFQRTTTYVSDQVWEWRDWSSEKRFPSEKAALKAFRRKGLVRQIPYVEYRAVCVFPGRSKDAARQAEIEAANAARQEYREHYIEHLEEKLIELKRDAQALPS